MTIRAVIFDIGGVLEITPDLGVTTKWEKLLGLKPGQLNARMIKVWEAGSIGKITEEEVRRAMAKILGISAEQVDAFFTEMWQEYLGTLNTELVAYVRVLRACYQTAIISNSFVGAREREQSRYGFADLCDLVVYSHEEGIAKPDPRIYRLACQRLGVQPEEAIFVDDHEECVDAANEVGMHGVLFRNNAQAIAEIEALLAGPGAAE